jgi:hypothetical protein
MRLAASSIGAKRAFFLCFPNRLSGTSTFPRWARGRSAGKLTQGPFGSTSLKTAKMYENSLIVLSTVRMHTMRLPLIGQNRPIFIRELRPLLGLFWPNDTKRIVHTPFSGVHAAHCPFPARPCSSRPHAGGCCCRHRLLHHCCLFLTDSLVALAVMHVRVGQRWAYRRR